LRRKLLFTLGMIVIYRMGTFIPAPGISYGTVQQCIANNGSNHGIYDIVNLFSGGALLQLSIFALGVMPYITASIIIQLLRVVIPRFQELHDEGAQGQAKLTQYTRYLTIALALLNGTTIVSMARSGALIGNCPNIIPVDDIWHVLLIIITLCAGTTVIMWMGEQITERGVGNGSRYGRCRAHQSLFYLSLYRLSDRAATAHQDDLCRRDHGGSGLSLLRMDARMVGDSSNLHVWCGILWLCDLRRSDDSPACPH